MNLFFLGSILSEYYLRFSLEVSIQACYDKFVDLQLKPVVFVYKSTGVDEKEIKYYGKACCQVDNCKKQPTIHRKKQRYWDNSSFMRHLFTHKSLKLKKTTDSQPKKKKFKFDKSESDQSVVIHDNTLDNTSASIILDSSQNENDSAQLGEKMSITYGPILSASNQKEIIIEVINQSTEQSPLSSS